nr:hypothetical protein [candidate division Zixibacteria bacterium]
MMTLNRFLPVALIIVLGLVFTGCLWSSNTATHTGPPPRTAPLDTAGSDSYHLSYLPESLTVEFTVPGNKPCPVKVNLHKTPRQIIRVIVDSVFAPGKYAISWDKKDSAGGRLPQGLYYYHYYICDSSYTQSLDYRRHWE